MGALPPAPIQPIRPLRPSVQDQQRDLARENYSMERLPRGAIMLAVRLQLVPPNHPHVNSYANSDWVNFNTFAHQAHALMQPLLEENAAELFATIVPPLKQLDSHERRYLRQYGPTIYDHHYALWMGSRSHRLPKMNQWILHLPLRARPILPLYQMKPKFNRVLK